MLEEVSVIDSINVTATNSIEVRRANKILRDGVEIAKTYHRHVLQPGDDLTNEDQKVKDIAAAVWV